MLFSISSENSSESFSMSEIVSSISVRSDFKVSVCSFNFFCDSRIAFLASIIQSLSASFGRSYITLAETGRIEIAITLRKSSLMMGFNWATFFGTPTMPSVCSDADILELSTGFPWVWIEPGSGSLRSSIPVLKAERIYRQWACGQGNRNE